MNLHRADTKPEWELSTKRNVFQKVAATTGGIVTLGNLVSLAGAAFVASGLIDIANGNTRKGIMKVAVGRGADLVDGLAADKTKTKSPLGEATDVVIDKAELMVGLPVLIAKGIAPKSFGFAAVAQTVANGYYTKTAKAAGNEIHTGAEGKYSTFLQWTALGLYGVSAMMRESPEYDQRAEWVERGADVVAVASIGLGVLSVASYRRQALAESSVVPNDEALPPTE